MTHRYLAYCRAQGRTPEAQRAHDRIACPGGSMAGFIVWMGQQWQAWRSETRITRALFPEDHAAFDRWLDARTSSTVAA